LADTLTLYAPAVTAPPSLTTASRLEARCEALRQTPAWSHYQRAREFVLAALEAEGASAGDERASAYWREELSGFEYMLDASPLIVEKLRHHTHHLTGLRPYEYRSNATARERLLADKLARLRTLGGDELLVEESSELGGFGFRIDGRLVNLDTLKYFEVLIALRLGGALDPLRARPESRIVEIGGGWGGLAYQLKSVLPGARYVIVDLPEVLLFSATYLPTVLPDATISFAGELAPVDWDADFVFVPHHAIDAVRPPGVDLAVNTVSFQEMTTEQVRAYVGHLAEIDCPALYSLNRDRSLYNRELSNVRDLIGERYRVHEIGVLDLDYPEMPDRFTLARRAVQRRLPVGNPGVRYRHVLGWLRGAG
jgi:putative sugar O-methyltransferase